jgi:hypothetical protein
MTLKDQEEPVQTGRVIAKISPIMGKRDGGRKTREVRNEYLSDGFEAARPWPH